MNNNITYKIINDKQFIIKEIKPYILFDNGTRYTFDSAKIGIEMIINKDKTETNNPVIINEYTHPTLMYENIPFQKISMPEEKNENISISDKISVLLERSERVLTNYNEKSCVYCHILSSPIFDKYKIK
jgi:hypothetical protein